jgi:hypothetical protein
MRFTMRTLTVAIVGALCLPVLSLLSRAAEENPFKENPFKNAKAGDWIEYTMSTDAMGQKMEMQVKQTVVAKDDTSVTLRMETTMMGQTMPGNDMKIPLDQPWNPLSQRLSDAKVTTLGEGNETVTVGGKSYACHWVQAKIVTTKPQATEGTLKVWTCKDVPVNGMVRMEAATNMVMQGQAMKTAVTMELKDAGRQ